MAHIAPLTQQLALFVSPQHNEKEYELPAWLGRLVWGLELAKGASHKYLRKIPTGRVSKRGKPTYRYYYKVTGGHGLGHHSEIVEGAAFAVKDAGKIGHFHVTHVDAASPHGPQVTIQHDESGSTHTISLAALRALLKREHAQAIIAAQDAAAQHLAQTKQTGSKKQQARAQALHDHAQALRPTKKTPPPAPEDTTPPPQEETKETFQLVAPDAETKAKPKKTPKPENKTAAEIADLVKPKEDEIKAEEDLEATQEKTPIPVVNFIQAAKTSANRPPNFLGLQRDLFKTLAKPYVAQNGRTYRNFIFDPNNPDPFLASCGFYDAVTGDGDQKSRDWRQNWFLTLQGNTWNGLVQGDAYQKEMGEKRQSWVFPVVADLTSWWGELDDEEREEFWDRFVNPSLQTDLTATINDSRHNDEDFSIPPGMEKMKEKGWSFHPYQKKAINFCAKYADRALLAMEMGLGKTLTAVALFHHLKNKGDADQMIVTAPLSAHGSWEQHFADLSDARVSVLSGATKKKRDQAYADFAAGKLDVLVITPETLESASEGIPWNVIDKKLGKFLGSYGPGESITLSGNTESNAIPFAKLDSQKGWVLLHKPETYKRPPWQSTEDKLDTHDLYGHAAEHKIEIAEEHHDIYNKKIDTLHSVRELGEAERNAATKNADGTWTIHYRSDKFDGDPNSATSEQLVEHLATTLRARFRNTGVNALGVNVEDKHADSTKIRSILNKKGGKVLKVADEVQKYKNADSRRGSGFVETFGQTPGRLVGMTGTPKPNGIADFYNILSGIEGKGSRGVLGSFEDFQKRFCLTNPYNNKILSFIPEKTGELYNTLAPLTFVRTTADADARLSLPPRIDLAPPIDMDEDQKEIASWFAYYGKLKREANYEGDDPRRTAQSLVARELLSAAIDGAKGPIHRAAAKAAPTTEQTCLLRMTQLATSPTLIDDEWKKDFPKYESPKLAHCLDGVAAHLQSHPDRAAVVFCEYNGAWEEARIGLEARGVPANQIGLYTGALSPKKRKELVAAVNDGKIKVLLGNTAALETGANLQRRANFVTHLNTPWAPDRLTQSTARVYRQGQEAPVTVLRPVGSEVEALIERATVKKILQSSQVQGKTTVADEKAADSLRKKGKTPELDARQILKTAGFDVSLFGEDKPALVSADDHANLETLDQKKDAKK